MIVTISYDKPLILTGQHLEIRIPSSGPISSDKTYIYQHEYSIFELYKIHLKVDLFVCEEIFCSFYFRPVGWYYKTGLNSVLFYSCCQPVCWYYETGLNSELFHRYSRRAGWEWLEEKDLTEDLDPRYKRVSIIIRGLVFV